MNKLVLIGNLCRDPELRTTQSGLSVCNFTLAVNGRKKEDAPQYFRVTVWRQLGENCQKYLAKGRKVCVVGAVSVSTYQDRDGNTRANLDVVADDVEFLTPKGESGAAQATADVPEGYTEVTDDELPF